MELQAFVTETLVQLVNGVVEAQKKLADSGARINYGSSNRDTRIGNADQRFIVGYGVYEEKIDFDVAVFVSEGTTAGGGAGIRVWGIGIGGDVSKDAKSGSESRIKFSVPVMFPPHPPEK